MKKPKIFYGYWILAVCFLFTTVGVGGCYISFSFFIAPLQAAMGWSRTGIMAAFTLFLIFMGVGGIFIGRLVDRYGARKVLPVGALVITIGLVLVGTMSSLWQYYLGYAIIGIGSAGIGPVTTTYLLSHWFEKRRGLAIGIMSMGMGVAGVVFAPLIAVYLLPHFGLSHTYLALAVLTGGIIILLSLFVIRNRPADMGLFPDGIKPEVTASPAGAPAALPVSRLSLKESLATSAFWLIAAAVILTHFHAGVSQSVVPYLDDIGFPAGVGASAISITAITNTIGMFFFGWLCDRMPAKFAFIIGLVLLALGIFIMVMTGPASPVWMVWLYAIVFGFSMGSWMPCMAMLTSTTFGLAAYGTLYGLMTLCQNIGGSASPLLAGYLYDRMNTYHWAFVIFLCVVLLAIVPLLLIHRPKTTG